MENEFFENNASEKDIRAVLREKREEVKKLSNELDVLKQGDRDIDG